MSSLGIGHPPPAKRGKTERVCSVCKVWKSPQDDFSKSQRNKGANAKCKECIDAQQKGNQQKKEGDKEARRKIHEERTRLAAENREAKRKKLEAQYKLADEKREKRKVAAKLLEVEELNKVIAANEKKEAEHYKQMRRDYEVHVQKLTSERKDIEKEMVTPSNLVYVVTSICKREDTEFSPHLQGIFTTCQKAKERARKIFGNMSKSYRDGKFDVNENRTAKCDTTEFLIPGVECNIRVMFELFGKVIKAPQYSFRKNEYVYECTAVGVTTIPIDSEDIAGMDLPFLQTLTWRQEDDAMTKGTPVVEGTEVYPVFTHIPSDRNRTDVYICGVFRKKESAIKCSLEERKEILAVQKASFKVYNGIPFYQMLHENCCSVDIHNVTLDAHESIKKELGFGPVELGFGSKTGIWKKPEIEWYDIS